VDDIKRQKALVIYLGKVISQLKKGDLKRAFKIPEI